MKPMSVNPEGDSNTWSRDLPVPVEASRDREVPAPARRLGSTLWLGVAVGFGLLALAWTAMFFFASKHRPAEVPLEHREAR